MSNSDETGHERLAITVLREEPVVGKREVETGKVAIRKTVTSRDEEITSDLNATKVHIERVPKNEFVSEPPKIREEGDLTVIPVLEEVLHVEKRLLLREEIHIRRRSESASNKQKVTLRTEHVEIQNHQEPPHSGSVEQE